MPDTSQTLPLFGFGIGTRSPNVSAQMRENLYVDKPEDPDKSPLVLYGRPGLTRFAQIQGAPAGIIADVVLAPGFGGEWLLLAPAGAQNLYRVNGAGFPAAGAAISSLSPPVGPVTIGAGPIRGANNGTQAIWRDGAQGFLTDLTSNVFNTTPLWDTISNPNATAFPQNCKSITFCASRFVVDDPSVNGRWRWSAAGDGSSWNSLDFATAESNPDALTCVFEAGGQLLLFGTQTIEFWAPAAAGASGQQPFVRVGGANIQWGTNAVDTIRKANNAVMFMGRNLGGNRQIVLLQGYDAQPVSTPDIDLEIQNDPRADAATAFFVTINGHPFYVLNLSTGRSWAYDLRTQSWSKWTTEGSRFAGQWAYPAFGQLLLTDYRDGRIYAFDANAYTDDGATLVRELISKHASANLARMSCQELVVDCETGVGQNGSAPTTGVGTSAAPQIMMQWSKNGARTWGNEVWQSLGPIGEFLQRAVWRNLGRARDWVFRLRITDPVKVVIIGAAGRFAP